MQQTQNLGDTAPQPAKTKFRFTVWGILATLIALASLGWALWMYAQIRPVNERHHSSTPFPWTGENVTVQAVSAYWKSAKGDARMEMRAAYFPVAEIRLAGGEGRGIITVTFHDEWNRQVAEAVHIPYENGHFRRGEENWVSADGDKALCRIEAGFENAGDLDLHRISTDTPLWKAKVIYRAEGADSAHFLGTVTVAPDAEQQTK